VMTESRAVIGGLVAQHQRRGLIPDDAPPEAIARVLIALIDGFMVQIAMDDDADPAAFRAGLKALMSAGTAIPQ
jgi:TetR/AcrR family transcriptional regulator, transcriptional repressor of aconitase